ncbi:MAG: hypothetical protein ACYC41_13860 [Bacillota bacterium]
MMGMLDAPLLSERHVPDSVLGNHPSIPSPVRATALSVLNTAAFLGSTLILAGITPVSDRIGLGGVMLIAAGLAVTSGVSMTVSIWQSTGRRGVFRSPPA